MKYHYQQGIIEKDKKGHKKFWLAFSGLVGAAAYGGFIFASLALNGWPLEPVDKTARLVKSSKPGSLGDQLFIPAINLNSGFGGPLTRSGDPKNENVRLKGNDLAFNVTPASLRSSSPFFNVDKLKDGDEIYLDVAKTRYAYRINGSLGKNDKKLTLQGKGRTITAEAIGIVAWNGRQVELQSL